MRLDIYLVRNGTLRSRTLAKEFIEKGFVSVNGKTVCKASLDVYDSDEVSVNASPPRYVSRGGEKLESALERFDISVRDKVCCDVGASTGGFTDCLLQHGAKRVYSVDSGTAQIDPALASDPRVVSIENFNARALTPETIGEACDLVTVDVSFISQNLILPAALTVLKKGGGYVGLIKPQFECGRSGLGKGGVVKSAAVRDEAVRSVSEFAAECGLDVIGVIPSPLTGGDGNIEYLIYGIKIR
ncbi:MAG: TlyA family RNA methyltransferase [Clostridia bacterium]|nr:TlyA family RNA methyltransferase [Clostridia bacterium]MBR7032308.1 TlyA family RNA methyltransferase [Clostridia bacterium]